MEAGIFSTVFVRPTLEASLDACAAAGIRAIQFDCETAGLDQIPEHIPDGLPERVRDACVERGIEIAALAGTWNMIDPDEGRRAENLARFEQLLAACPAMGVSVVTICTGTRDPASMWRYHPDNETPAAWADLRAVLERVLPIADDNGADLAFEPEPANVLRDAATGRAMLDDLRHPRLKVCLDPANIVAGDLTSPPGEMLARAIDLLGDEIVTTHAKDIDASGAFCPAGTGIVPWAENVHLLRTAGYDGALVMHTLTEADVPSSLAVIQAAMAG